MNLEQKITQSAEVVIEGERWFLFLARYQTPEGTFGLHFYAQNSEHAAALIGDIRETLTLDGQFGGAIRVA